MRDESGVGPSVPYSLSNSLDRSLMRSVRREEGKASEQAVEQESLAVALRIYMVSLDAETE